MRRSRWILLGAAVVLLGLPMLVAAAGHAFLAVLPDAQRGATVAAVLSRLLPGNFTIGAIGPGLPGHVDLRDVRIASPADEPVIEVDHLQAHSSWSALLHGRLDFSDIVIDHAVVHIRQAEEGGPVDIAATFDERQLHPEPPGEEVEPAQEGPPLVRCDHITVQAAEVLIDTPDASLRFTEAHVQDANLTVQGNSLALEAAATADMVLKAGKDRIAVRHIHVKMRPTQYRFAVNNKRVDTTGVHVEMPGLAVSAQGAFDATEKAVKSVQARVNVRAEADMPLLGPRLPAKLRSLLKGTLQVQADVSGADGRQEANVTLQGDKLRFGEVPVDDGRFRLHATPVRGGLGSRLVIHEATVHVQFIEVRIRGDAVLMLDGTVLQHNLQINTESLPLRRMVTPFVNAPEYIPARASLDLSTQGPTLWPLGSHVVFKALASGNSAPVMRLLPDPFMVRGALRTHPGDIDIEMLQFGSESSPLQLEGKIPLRPDGVLDIVSNVRLKR